jgi:hypothetical protein
MQWIQFERVGRRYRCQAGVTKDNSASAAAGTHSGLGFQLIPCYFLASEFKVLLDLDSLILLGCPLVSYRRVSGGQDPAKRTVLRACA